jgi:hypothetical protein
MITGRLGGLLLRLGELLLFARCGLLLRFRRADVGLVRPDIFCFLFVVFCFCVLVREACKTKIIFNKNNELLRNFLRILRKGRIPNLKTKQQHAVHVNDTSGQALQKQGLMFQACFSQESIASLKRSSSFTSAPHDTW